VTVAVPTLAADPLWRACVAALRGQTFRDFEVVIIDNSGRGEVLCAEGRVIRNAHNVGFGTALNQAWRSSQARYLAALNDDAMPEADWLARLVEAMEADPHCGMAASEVRLPDGTLDSAGMVIARDGSSLQRRAKLEPEALLPSGSAALYRREMLEQTGGFDESFFLYCEDTDLGLRARWLGWGCRYASGAVVTHQYSSSAGRASALKAYLVERNRLRLIVKNFPLSWLVVAKSAALVRYFWHLALLIKGSGKAAEFRAAGPSAWLLVWFVIKAHLALLRALPALLLERWKMPRRISGREMRRLLRKHLISLREVAAH